MIWASDTLKQTFSVTKIKRYGAIINLIAPFFCSEIKNLKFILTFYFQRNIIMKNSVLKVINMNLALSSASKYFFGFSVVFYFGYACFAVEKLLVRA